MRTEGRGDRGESRRVDDLQMKIVELSSRRGEKRPNESKSGTNLRVTSGSRTGQE